MLRDFVMICFASLVMTGWVVALVIGVAITIFGIYQAWQCRKLVKYLAIYLAVAAYGVLMFSTVLEHKPGL